MAMTQTALNFFLTWAARLRAQRHHSATGVDLGVTPANLCPSLGLTLPRPHYPVGGL